MSVTLGTVTLPNPQLGNQEMVDFNNINRTTRGLTRKIYKHSLWATKRRYLLDFQNLTHPEAIALRTYLIANIGKEITYVDYLGESITAIVLSHNAPLLEVRRIKNADEFAENPCGTLNWLYNISVELLA